MPTTNTRYVHVTVEPIVRYGPVGKSASSTTVGVGRVDGVDGLLDDQLHADADVVRRVVVGQRVAGQRQRRHRGDVDVGAGRTTVRAHPGRRVAPHLADVEQAVVVGVAADEHRREGHRGRGAAVVVDDRRSAASGLPLSLWTS